MSEVPQYTTGDLEKPLTGSVGVDVTAAEGLSVHVRRHDGSVITRAAQVTDAETGAWTMPWETGDLTVGGNYLAEVEVMWPGDRPQTFGPARFYVRTQIA